MFKNILGYFFLLVFFAWGTSLFWIASPAITPLEQYFIDRGFSEVATVVITQAVLFVSLIGFFVFLPEAPPFFRKMEQEGKVVPALAFFAVFLGIYIAVFAYLNGLPMRLWLPIELIALCLWLVVYLEHKGKGPSTWFEDKE